MLFIITIEKAETIKTRNHFLGVNNIAKYCSYSFGIINFHTPRTGPNQHDDPHVILQWQSMYKQQMQFEKNKTQATLIDTQTFS